MYVTHRQPNQRNHHVIPLAALSSRVVAYNVSKDLTAAWVLPSQLKTVLITILSYHELLTPNILRVLVHNGLVRLRIEKARDAHLRQLRSCINLNSLSIPRATISKTGLSELFHWLPQLEELDVSGCLTFDDSVLDLLTMTCPELRLLNAANCPYISDSGVQHLALRSRFLSVLDLSCTGISDEALVFLSQGCCRSVLNQLKHNVPPAKLNK